MHAKPGLRVLLKWMINRSGSVITDVIWLQGDSIYAAVQPVRNADWERSAFLQ